MLAAILPVMAAHYALGLGAIGAPAAWVVPMLVLDSVLVGYLGALIVAFDLHVSRRPRRAPGKICPSKRAPEPRPVLPSQRSVKEKAVPSPDRTLPSQALQDTCKARK
jgi:hypothetical protein